MRKKSLIEQNKKRLRIIFLFLMVIMVLVIIGGIFITTNRFGTDLYKAFVYNFIGTSFLFAAGLTFCIFILYHVFLITVYNPQRIKKSSVIKFACSGIITLIFTIVLLTFGGTEAKKSIQSMKDYENGEWQVKDVLVTDIYRGSRGHKGSYRSNIVLIDTDIGEMTLYFEDFLIYKGEKYRFTYLDATNTIIKVENIID
ncbi:hypothetical protein M3193_09375 [Sporosarcina luteola]|uniref:hypothetical protein n=1 Tax=Sporosarcina luteola TaxID=582850 RepID=UPI00203D6C0B|nr:hypothetical protein [Sporosarcina luteola]MCM3744352.1 hypothetical protein [Sporosarcina luteola]